MGFAPVLKDASGARLLSSTDGIASLEAVELNGARQWISVRGQKRDAPVLLFLHGGPGMPEMANTRRYFAGPIEASFVVVNWDQRGAGKSFGAAAGAKLGIDLLLADTLALVDYLRRRFNKDKIFIVGHSWGSLLGTLFVAAYPGRVAAYGGVGQFVSGPDNEKVSYRWALEEAKAQGKKKVVRGLEAIAAYGEDPLSGDWFRNVQVERKWLKAVGGEVGHDPRFHNQILRDIFLAPEYSLADKMGFVRGAVATVKALWPEVLAVDLRKKAPRLEVPVAFFTGRYDFNTPRTLAEDYLESLVAPRKEMVYFENSAHSPCYEEPELFARELLRFFLGL
jgi:pimeloyl-ACP methyl ester carboxylesterase